MSNNGEEIVVRVVTLSGEEVMLERKRVFLPFEDEKARKYKEQLDYDLQDSLYLIAQIISQEEVNANNRIKIEVK